MIDLQKNAFFFDFDGTLIDLALNYQDIVVPDYLPDLLNNIYKACGGAAAIITGRNIADILNYINIKLPIAGLHGAEYYDNGIVCQPSIDKNFIIAKNYVNQHSNSELKIEDKNLNIAIHYKTEKIQALNLAYEAIKKFQLTNYEVLLGKNVVELKLKDFNKAVAVNYFMHKPEFKGRIPVCFGDDVTDEDMFEAALLCQGKAFCIGNKLTNFKQSYPIIESSRDLHNYLEILLQENKI